MHLSSDMQARKDALLGKNKKTISLGFCQIHQTLAVCKDTMGYAWCEECRARHDLINWGEDHHWPLIYIRPYAIAEGYFFWQAAALLGRLEAISKIYTGLTSIEEEPI